MKKTVYWKNIIDKLKNSKQIPTDDQVYELRSWNNSPSADCKNIKRYDTFMPQDAILVKQECEFSASFQFADYSNALKYLDQIEKRCEELEKNKDDEIDKTEESDIIEE